MGQMIGFKRPDGGRLDGYLAEPASGQGPGIVVIQEWWGLNPQIRGVADRLADAGFLALVPDLYRGRSTGEAEEAHHLMAGLNFADAATQDLRGAVQCLQGRATRIGMTGFCVGGALALLALPHAPEVEAAVVWYGYPLPDDFEPAGVRASVMAHWATEDPVYTLAGAEALEGRLKEAGVPYEGHRYFAHHAFANETAQGRGRVGINHYDAAWARMAWDRTLVFFGRRLG